MNIPCATPCVACPPNPAGSEGIFPNPNAEANPFNNFSSEKPDVDIFIGINYGGGTGGNGGPPIGSPFTASGCIGTCFSFVSQEEADICAYNQQQFCGPWGPFDPNPNPPGGPGGGPTGTSTLPFGNDAQSCPEKCAGGITNGYLVPAGAVSASTPNGANSYAHYIACIRTTCGNDAQICTVFCPDGSPFSFTVPAGTFYAVNRDTANAIAYSYACKKASQNKVCLSQLSNSRTCAFQPYSGIIQAANLFGAVTFEVTAGSLPPGTALSQVDPVTALISGVPTVTGDFTFSVTVTSSIGSTMIRQYVISVIAIATADPLPDATIGTPYSVTLTGDGVLATTPTWAVVSGSLPPGLSLDSDTGEISGTPTGDSASYGFTAGMTDALTTCFKTFTLTVNSVACDIPFESLVWVDDCADPNGNPLASCIPASAGFVADQFSYTVPDDVNNVSVYGSMVFTGPATYGRLTVNSVTSVTHNVPGTGVGQIIVYDADTFAVYLNQAIAIGDSGEEFPFLIPMSAARNVKIWVLGNLESSVSCSLDCNPPCPEWNKMLWDVPTINVGGTGSASFSPNGTASETFTAAGSSPGFPNGNGFAENTTNVPDYFDYTGPGCNCRLRLDLSGTGDLSNAAVTYQVFVFIVAPFSILVNENTVVSGDPFNPGVYDLPFVLPDTAGATIKIGAQVQLTVDGGNGLPASAQIIGTFSNP